MTHIPFTDFDMHSVKKHVEDTKNIGLTVSYDASKSDKGIVTVHSENWINQDGPFVIFEIHKVGKKRLIGHRITWIVQLYSQKSKEGQLKKHGCKRGKTLLRTWHNAGLDCEADFLSMLSFEDAYAGAIE